MEKDDPITLKIVRLYAEGIGILKIGALVYLDYRSVRNRLHSAGVILRENVKSHISQEKIEQIRALRDNGCSTKKVAEITGVSDATVRKYYKHREINYVENFGEN